MYTHPFGREQRAWGCRGKPRTLRAAGEGLGAPRWAESGLLDQAGVLTGPSWLHIIPNGYFQTPSPRRRQVADGRAELGKKWLTGAVAEE